MMDLGKNQQWMLKPSVTVSWGTKYLLILKLCPSLLLYVQKVKRNIYSREVGQTRPQSSDQSKQHSECC